MPLLCSEYVFLCSRKLYLKHNILPSKEYVVGRKECSILIEGDKSISRMHATLTVSQHKNQAGVAVLTLRDLKSKFGTYVNKEKIGSTSRGLTDGDILQFGVLQSEWSVHWKPLVVTTSCVTSSADKKALKEALIRIGGKMVGDWQRDCTYLVMTQLTITVKAVCALITCKPIVTPTYFQSLVETIDSKSSDPDPKQFLPPLAEASLQSREINFHPDERRKRIFSNKRFLFLSSKQHKKMCTGIELGGGETVLLTSKPDEETLLTPGVCVMSFPPDLHTQTDGSEWAEVITAILHRHSRRTIPESELGLAVLHCSTEEYCNPEFDIGGALLLPFAMPSQSLSQISEIYAIDTQTSPSQSVRPVQTQSLLSIPTQQRSIQSSKISTIPETRREVRRNAGHLSEGGQLANTTETTSHSSATVGSVVSSSTQDTRGELRQGTRQFSESGQTTNTMKNFVQSSPNFGNSVSSSTQDTRGELRQGTRQFSESGQTTNTMKNFVQSSPNFGNSVMSSSELEITARCSATESKRERTKDLALEEPAAKVIKLETQLESIFLEPQSCYTEVGSNSASIQSMSNKIKNEIPTRPTSPQSDDEMFEWDKPLSKNTVQLVEERTPNEIDTKPNLTPSLISVNCNGPSSSVAVVSNREEQMEYEDSAPPSSPEQVAVIEFCRLIKKKPEVSRTDSQNGCIVNFKKFKKAKHFHSNRLPNIIGGRDLVYDSEVRRPRTVAGVEDDNMEEATGQRQQQLTQDAALFDW